MRNLADLDGLDGLDTVMMSTVKTEANLRDSALFDFSKCVHNRVRSF